MEPVGVFIKEDWECALSKMFSCDEEEGDIALQFLQGLGTPSDLWPNGQANDHNNVAVFDESALLFSSENFNTDSHLSQDITTTIYSSTSPTNYIVCYPSHYENQHYICDSNILPLMNNIHEPNNFCEQNNALARVFPNEHVNQEVVEDIGGSGTNGNVDGTHLGLKRKFEMPKQPEAVDDYTYKNVTAENSKKKSRVPRDNSSKNMGNGQPKKNQKVIQKEKSDESSNFVAANGQISSSYSSEDDSNASQEIDGATKSDSKLGSTIPLNSSGKARAGRGAAIDPQSLYARKRRERINERLRILQNLVPNGTKVDISTMLEEAVHYVKFLQLQIKLLSSDDMWMYAPIAYNGMDMGLYHKISATL